MRYVCNGQDSETPLALRRTINAFGSRSQPAIHRVRETVSEIKKDSPHRSSLSVEGA
jgi:hypothetical protein